MIARGFKPVAWVAAVGTAALGCYMLSLRVASERAELTGLEHKIVNTEKAIRSLQTELETRGRVTQLQQWNDDVLALAPPSASQFLDSQMMLARFSIQPTPVLDDQAEVRMASAEVPAATAPATRAPTLSPQRAVADARPVQAAPGQAVVQRASLTVSQPAAPPAPAATQLRARTEAQRPAAQPARMRTASAEAPVRARTAPPQQANSSPQGAKPSPPRTRIAAAEPARRTVTAQAPSRPRALLDDRTVRDLGSAARTERRGGTRN